MSLHCRFAGTDFSFSRSFLDISGWPLVQETHREVSRVLFATRYKHRTNVTEGAPGLARIK